MNRMSDLSLSAYGMIMWPAKAINDGLNNFESELNYVRAYSGLISTVVHFPKKLQEVTSLQAFEALQHLSETLAPVADTLGSLKGHLNWFELFVRVNRVSGMPGMNVWKGFALIAQIGQKAIESIFLEPTGKKWNWYSPATIARFTHIHATRLTLTLTKEACVFASSIFGLLGTSQEKVKTQSILDRKVTSLDLLRKLNVQKDPTPRTATPKAATPKGSAPAQTATHPRVVETDRKAQGLTAKAADLRKILSAENLGDKQALYYEYLAKTREAPVAKPSPSRLQAYYNQAGAWFQTIAFNAETRAIDAEKRLRFVTSAAQAAEAKRLNAAVTRLLDPVIADLNKTTDKLNRQTVWYSTAPRYNENREELRQYKIHKKEVQIANLKNEMTKHSWANWFDWCKLSISTFGVLSTLKEETSPVSWIFQQLNQAYVKQAVIAGLFINIFAISAIGLGRTRHLAIKAKELPPAPRMPRVLI